MKFWQKLRNSAAVLSCVAVMAGSSIAAAQVVTVDGYGDDRSSAVNDAKRNAVEQVIGSYLQATTIVNDGKIILDDIYARSSGFIRNIDILSEERMDGRYRIVANIDILDELKSEAQKQLMTVTSLNNPRIGISLTGINKGRRVATHYMRVLETDIVQYLLSKGMTHIIVLDNPTNTSRDIGFVSETQDFVTNDEYNTLLTGDDDEPPVDGIGNLPTGDNDEPPVDGIGNLTTGDNNESPVDGIGNPQTGDGGEPPVDDVANLPIGDTSEPPADKNEDGNNNEDDGAGMMFSVSKADNIQLEENVGISLINDIYEQKKVDYILDGTLIINSSSIKLPDYKTMTKANVKLYDTGLMKVNMIFQGRVNHSDSGELMGEVSLNNISMDNTSEAAMLKGIAVLGTQVGKKIWELFKQGSAIMPHSISLSVRCRDYDKVLKLSDKLRDQAGIQNVSIRDYEEGVANLSIDTELTTAQLFKIMKSYDSIFITMEKQSDGMLEINMG